MQYYNVILGHSDYGYRLAIRSLEDKLNGFSSFGLDHLRVLRGHIGDSAAMADLRRLLMRTSGHVTSIHDLSDEQIILLLEPQFYNGSLTMVRPATGKGLDTARLSGATWWKANEANYPNSSALSDLESSFRKKVENFLAALDDAGAKVKVSSTLRNAKRAYLMHFSWAVAHGIVAPSAVPAEPGVDIIWDHKDLKKSKAAALEMVNLFHMAYIASLTSRHIKGLAVDMDISWSGTLKIQNAKKVTVEIGSPRDGARNDDLHDVGATYGVKKLLSDPPHWSSDGH
jgi:hypothetical protein